MHYGARLEAIAALVPSDARVVDVGTDHAYLLLCLARQKKIKEAVAVDIADGPEKDRG